MGNIRGTYVTTFIRLKPLTAYYITIMFNTIRRKEFIESLRSKYYLRELNHAFRMNEILDIFKGNENVFDNINKKHFKFKTHEETEAFVTQFLIENKGSFGNLNSNSRLSYGSFKNRLNVAKNKTDIEQPEDMYWNQNIDSVIESDLYFLFHNGFVKIGRTRNMQNRIKQLKTSLSSKYECFVVKGKGNLEKKFHFVFSEFAQNGEWFIEHKRMRSFIEKRLNDNSAYKFQESNKRQLSISKSGTILQYNGKPKIKRNDGKLGLDDKMTFGKYRGVKMSEILEKDFDYILWMEAKIKEYKEKFSDEFKREVIRISGIKNKKSMQNG